LVHQAGYTIHLLLDQILHLNSEDAGLSKNRTTNWKRQWIHVGPRKAAPLRQQGEGSTARGIEHEEEELHYTPLKDTTTTRDDTTLHYATTHYTALMRSGVTVGGPHIHVFQPPLSFATSAMKGGPNNSVTRANNTLPPDLCSDMRQI
jgi:hypothetical protein